MGIWVTTSSSTPTPSSLTPSETEKEPEPEPRAPSPPPPPPIVPVVHPHVECDKSDQSPLQGTRYHKVGANYDLNEEEFAKLDDIEKTQYELLLRPGGPIIRWEPVVHYGVTCDVSNVSPVFGVRFHKIGENYDLTQTEFAKLSEEEKRAYELINHPRATPVPYYVAPPPAQDDGELTLQHLEKLIGAFFPGVVHVEAGCQQRRCPRNGKGKGKGGACPQRQQQRQCPQRQQRYQRPGGIAAGDVLPAAQFGIGAFGPGVKQLQWFLIANDFMDESAIKWRAGVYGPRTREAIYKFQVLNAVETENQGVYDQPTVDALTSLVTVTTVTPTPTPTQPVETKAVETPPPVAPKPTAPSVPEPQQPSTPTPTPTTTTTPSPSDDDDLVVVDQPWTEELKILEGMGFTDKEQLKLLLNENKTADPERVLLATIAALLK